MALFSLDFSGIFQSIKTFLGPFGKLIDKAKAAFDHLTNIIANSNKLIESVIAEIDGWRNFKQDIRFSQRVIQIERAIQKTRDLIEGIPASWRAIVDIFKQFKGKLEGVGANPAEDAEAAIEDVEAGGVSGLLKRFPALAKGLEKILGVLALIVDSLETISTTIDDLQTIVDELKAIRLEIERLDTIFLQQGNKRKTLRLEDGRVIRIRVGKLHS